MQTATRTRARRASVFALLLTATMGYGASALAQRGPDPFGTIDTNGDGKVSAEEFARHRAERMKTRAEEGRPMRHAGQGPSFEAMDVNRDGMLTPDEMRPMQPSRPGPGQGPGMRGGQGPSPVGGPRPPRFDEVDANGDGRIDQDELMQMRSKHLMERAEEGRPMKNAGNMESFEQMDLNGDGGISGEEFGAHIQRDRERMRP